MGVKSVNEIQTHPRTYRDTVGDAVVTGRARVFGMYLTAAADAASLTINNALTTAGGGRNVVLKAPISTSVSFLFEPAGHVFEVGLSIASTGTNPILGVSYIEES